MTRAAVERSATVGRPEWISWSLLAAGVGIASFAPILIRHASDAHPLAISFWRCAGGALALAPFARRGLAGLDRRHIRLSAIAGAFLAVHFATWIASVDLTTVASSVLLVSTSPVFVALVAPWIVAESLIARGWSGMVVALVGTAVIAGADFGGSSLEGNLLALAGGASAAGYVLSGRLARKDLGILPYAALTYGVSAALLAVVCLTQGTALWGWPAGTWWAIVGLTVGPQIIGHTAINYVLSDLDATSVSVSLLFEPVIATALAAWLLAEVPPALVYPAGVAVLAGIYLVSTGQRRVDLVSPT